MSKVIDIRQFKRIHVPQEKRLVIAAQDTADRRLLLSTLKEQRSPLRAWAHLSPEGKKNKITVYQQIKSTDTKVEDRGDEIIIYWRKDTFFTVTIDLLKNPAVVEDRLEYFLGELMVKEARLIPPTLPQLPTPP
jgi:hypothetical protein